MYLWKYWRESRLTFAVGMVVVGLLLWSVLRIPVGYPGPARSYSQGGVTFNTAQPLAAQIYLVIGSRLILLLGLLGLRYGGLGAGSDLGEGSGSFLFSRPRTRAFFVWSDWSYGMVQLLLLVVAMNGVELFGYHRLAAGSGPAIVGGVPVSMFSIFCLHCVVSLLLTGFVFGLSYFASVLVKSRGALLVVGLVIAYSIGKQAAMHYWPGVALPELTLTELSISQGRIAGFADHLGLSIALRAALALTFPIAAQILVQRRDID